MVNNIKYYKIRKKKSYKIEPLLSINVNFFERRIEFETDNIVYYGSFILDLSDLFISLGKIKYENLKKQKPFSLDVRPGELIINFKNFLQYFIEIIEFKVNLKESKKC